MTSTGRTRRWLLGVGLVAIGSGFGGLPQALAAARHPMAEGDEAVLTAGPADAAAVHGAHPDVSDDGRWVVYEGLPTDGSERASTIWLRDDDAPDAPPIEITPPVAGLRPGSSVRPSISGDGCFAVAVTEMAYDFFRDDDEDLRWDVYRLRLPQCVEDATTWSAQNWELVSTDQSATGDVSALDRVSPLDAAAVSETGAVIAYTHQRQRGRDALVGVTLVDLTIPLGDPNRARLVLGTPAGPPATEDGTRTLPAPTGQREPAVSADGRFLAFTSDARSDLARPEWVVPAEGPPVSQVYVWDRLEADPDRAVMLVSAVGHALPAAVPAADVPASDAPEADGPSRSTTAAPRTTTTTTTAVAAPAPSSPSSPASTAPAPTGPVAEADTIAVEPAADGASAPSISADGRFVAFTSASTDLVAGLSMPACLGGCPPQVYRFDRLARATVLVSRQNGGDDGAPRAAADLGAAFPSINADGSQVAFITRATNLFTTQAVAGLAATDGEVVVSQVDLEQLTRASALPDGITPAAATSSHPVLSATGGTIVFDTLSARDLVGATGPGRQVVSLRRPAQVAAPDLDVGTVVVGFAGPEWRIGVKNLGPSTFVPATVVSSTRDFAVTGGTCGLGVPVLPGDYCEVFITLTPSVAGPIAGLLTISEAGADPVTVTSRLSGQGGEPLLDPNPAGADFDSTVVGQQSSPKSFDITNIGFSVGTVASVRMSGADPKDFKIVSGGCIGHTMIPGSNCSLEIAFTPTAAGYRTATALVITDTGQYTGILLDGTGRFDPEVSLAADSVVAGDPIGLGGTGFAPGSDVTIAWSDGAGEPVVVHTDRRGGFLVSLPTRRTERAGERQIVVQGSDSVLSLQVRVARPPAERRPGSPTWGG